MYDPKGNGKDRAVDAVRFTEVLPPEHQQDVVHRFLELKTDGDLDQDYRFHALPDACAYIVFDQSNAEITGVTKLRASSEELNLGTSFHFVNVRLLPGVWQGPLGHGIIDGLYTGGLPLISVNQSLIGQDFATQQAALIALVDQLVADQVVVANPVTQKIFANMDDIHTVGDMAEVNQMSARQLQRVRKRTKGFAPHD